MNKLNREDYKNAEENYFKNRNGFILFSTVQTRIPRWQRSLITAERATMKNFDPLSVTRKFIEKVKHCNIKSLSRYAGCGARFYLAGFSSGCQTLKQQSDRPFNLPK
ncbi:hypothetical protein [Burkholderia cenocepacia]|uniref:hypothetical protein n=1 Tax=Burkholderia cenocepacia TaxID=95486 RepID=UPI001CF4D540|nr:hypothetical protein [Burkholderia cenocepacia]MCA8005949.1 hypothetical protein [Burkholderia cenocepacia]